MKWVFFASFGLLFLSGAPVAFCLSIPSLIYLLGSGIPLSIAVQKMVLGCESFVLLAVPFFILAAQIMNRTGVTERIFRFAQTAVGHIPGGLAHVNVVCSMIFAGMSGSAIADASGLGLMEMKAMDEAGYDKPFSAAITVATATIGPIIPPSIPMVIYGALAEASVGKLFLGGFTPGVIMGLAMMAYTYFIALRRGYPRMEWAGLRSVLRAFGRAFLALLTPVILLGGIYSGVFTPTEAAAVAVLYALILGLFVYRQIKPQELPRVMLAVVENTAYVMFVVASAILFGWILTRERIPQMATEFLFAQTRSPAVMLLILNLTFLALGCLMDTTPILLIFVPMVLPVVKALNIDVVHFGVVLILNLMIGLLTPPVGMLLFLICGMHKLSMAAVLRELWPYILVLVSVLFLITYVPSLVMWLPRLVG